MLTIRIDTTTKKYINYLKKHKVRYTDVIRESIKESLKEKCLQFELDLYKEDLPF